MLRKSQGLMGIFLTTIVGSVSCQPEFYDKPTQKWKSNVPPMGLGNGIVSSLDSQVVYATSANGTVTAMDPDDGNVTWSFHPPRNGDLPLSCNGEITISEDGKFFVYGVTEGNDGEDQTCRVVALGHPAGDFLWVSPILEGACSGTPVISGDGKLIFLNHNSNGKSIGHFSILSFSEIGAALLSTRNTVAPFAPPGIIVNPVRGNFEGGDKNERDVIIWSYMPTPDAIAVGPGGTFVFQLISDYSDEGSTADFDVKILSPEASWQSTTAPLIVAKGLSMYLSVSRSQLRAWVSTPNATNSTDGSFDQDRTHSVEFDRGNPSFLAPFVKPIVDDVSTPEVLCVGAANEEFFCLHAQNLTTIWSEITDSLIKTEARFSTNGDRVYFIEEDGILHAFNTTNGNEFFKEALVAPVSSNFDLSIDGALLYYGDEDGNVVALQLANSTLPPVMPTTRAPTVAPSPPTPTSPSTPTSPPTPTLLPTPTTAPGSPTQFPNSLSPTPTSSALQMTVMSMIGIASAVMFAFWL